MALSTLSCYTFSGDQLNRNILPVTASCHSYLDCIANQSYMNFARAVLYLLCFICSTVHIHAASDTMQEEPSCKDIAGRKFLFASPVLPLCLHGIGTAIALYDGLFNR